MIVNPDPGTSPGWPVRASMTKAFVICFDSNAYKVCLRLFINTIFFISAIVIFDGVAKSPLGVISGLI